jgi:hypothetical protein
MSKVNPRIARMRRRIRQADAAKAAGKLIYWERGASAANGMDAESMALANNPRFVSIIEKSRARYIAEGGIPIEEVRRQLGLPAKKKRRKTS